MLDFAWVIPLLPICAWLIVALTAGRLGKRAPLVGIGAMGLAFVMATGSLIGVVQGGHAGAHWLWAVWGSSPIAMGWSVDGLSAIMLFVVTLVSLLVQIYSTEYMDGDTRLNRYFGNLSLFTAAMLGLVIADNILLLFVCWELVGLASYLLIGHWFEKPSAQAACMKAFITTRVGDVGFMIGIFIIFAKVQAFGFADIFRAVETGQLSGSLLTTVAILVFMGAVGKSAQFPLHVWLPDAMEGPTPVSALIHAATMVAAGVYLVARTYPMFHASETAMLVVAITGTVTALFAATIALVMTDIKKVLAYSTVSQLGFMMLALGVGGYTAGVFHLMTHAFFKALLFLGSGSVIHACHTQEMHEMGGLYRKMKTTAITFLIGTAAIAGLPPFSGFWSKDEILLAAYYSGHPAFFWLGLLAASMTAFYMTRLCILTFFGRHRTYKAEHAHESSASMAIPLVILAAFAAVSGLPGSPLMGYSFAKLIHFGAEHEPSMFVMGLALASSILGIGLAWAVYGLGLVDRGALIARFRPLYVLLKNKYYVDEVYDAVLVRPLLSLCGLFSRFDSGVVDGAVNAVAAGCVKTAQASWAFDAAVVDGAVNGVAEVTSQVGQRIRRLQTGYVQSYAATLFAAIVIIVVAMQVAR